MIVGYIYNIIDLSFFKDYFLIESKYSFSTLSRAQGVFLRNLRLDLIEGFELKQLILILLPSSSHPNFSCRNVNMSINLIPCNGLLGCSLLMSDIV
jgi:hypothetical protein